MESLQHLIERGKLTSDEKPFKPDTIKVLKNGVIFQDLCYNGLPYDIAISWLQKAIRLGLTEQALFCAYLIYSLGDIFCSHLMNRLITICSEDIGPAEPGLVQEIRDQYFAPHNTDAIVAMTVKLANARKSRITDLLIITTHSGSDLDLNLDSTEVSNIEDMCKIAVYLCHTGLIEPITLEYTKSDGSIVKTRKLLQVYSLWKFILEQVPTDRYQDAVALLELFMKRGRQYGLIHLVHAISLIYYYIEEVTAKALQFPSWEEVSKYDFPVLNSAIDKHTRWGRRYLGRSSYDFAKYGSKLNPQQWTPFPQETELMTAYLNQTQEVEVLTPDKSLPRPYQQVIIQKAMEYYKQQSDGWLIMACGTGKTKTSYWISRQLQSKHIIVVVPYLEILNQIITVWSKMSTADRIWTHAGIIASSRYKFIYSNFFSYEYLSDIEQYQDMLKISARKVVFVTYQSIKYIINWSKQTNPADLVIYDEAHHTNNTHLFGSVKKLFLTATPKYRNDEIITKYHIEQAISDGYLVDYTIHVMSDQIDILDAVNIMYSYCTHIISYSSYAYTADSLFMTINMYSNHKSFFIGCKTPGDLRRSYIEQFRNSDQCIIFNCATLGEGVDIPCCNGVYIQSGYTSPVRIMQAIGRALRLSPGKTDAHIFITDKSLDVILSAIELYDPGVRNKIQKDSNGQHTVLS